MSDSTAQPSANLDLCQPFQLEQNHFRGRLVRLGPAIDHIVRRHDYPAPVARLLGEALLLCSALAGALKYEGVFTLQARGDGAISNIVADVTSSGNLRGYATFDAERVEIQDPGTNATALLLGKGHLAFTIDQGPNTERYQGIVDLSGRTIADCVSHYFQQSEQIPTAFVVACQQMQEAGADDAGEWRGGAVMLQRMPRAEEDVFGGSLRGGETILMNANENANENESPEQDLESRSEALRRKLILLSTATADELLDESLAPEVLLTRLFHEEELVFGTEYRLRDECRCSRARVENVLRSMPADELVEMAAENENKGHIDVTCEFCGRRYDFDEDAIANLDKVFSLDIAGDKENTADYPSA